MSVHPTDEALFDCAVHENPDVRAHVRGCPACEVRFRRLAAGASLIETAADPNASSGVNWRAIDPAILAAAEKTAGDIRAGRLRAPRRAHTGVYLGVALAAAAAGVMIVRAQLRGSGPAGVQAPVANARPERANPQAPERGPERVRAASAPVEGVVLMVVAPVTYTAPGGTPAAMGASTALRQGGRIAADDHGGRAVVAVHAGYRLDARAGADVTLAQLSSSEMLFALTKGEARVDGPASRETRVALQAGGWTVRAKGGAFVAGVEQDAIRVRVVAGKIGIVRGADGEEREVFAGDEILLAKNGGDVRVVSHSARDAQELDTAFMAPEGRAFSVPALPAGATVSVAGHGAMPAGLSVLRASGPVSLSARVGREEFALALDPAREAPSAWTRATRVAVRPGLARTGLVEPIAPVNTGGAAREQPVVAAREGASADEVAAIWRVNGTRVDQVRRLLSEDLSARATACFSACEQTHTCGSQPSFFVTIDMDPGGRVSDARPAHAGSDSLERCLGRVAMRMRVPSWVPEQRYNIEVHRPQ